MVRILMSCSLILLLIFYLVWKNQIRPIHGEQAYHPPMGYKHGESLSIDFYAHISRIRHWNATFKVSLAVLTLLLSIGLNNPYVSVAVIIAMAYIILIKGQLPLQAYLPILFIQMGFIFLGTFTMAIDFSKQPLGQYNLYLGLCYAFTSQAKLKEAVFFILKALAAVTSLQMMALSTPFSEIIHVLRRMHVPRILIELMNIIYRFIFILMDVYRKMRISAESRQGYCDMKTSYFTFGSIVSNMLVLSLQKANTYYDAMEARCFDGDLIFLEEDKKIEPIHLVSTASFLLFLILLWYLTK